MDEEELHDRRRSRSVFYSRIGGAVHTGCMHSHNHAHLEFSFDTSDNRLALQPIDEQRDCRASKSHTRTGMR